MTPSFGRDFVNGLLMTSGEKGNRVMQAEGIISTVVDLAFGAGIAKIITKAAKLNPPKIKQLWENN